MNTTTVCRIIVIPRETEMDAPEERTVMTPDLANYREQSSGRHSYVHGEVHFHLLYKQLLWTYQFIVRLEYQCSE